MKHKLLFVLCIFCFVFLASNSAMAEEYTGECGENVCYTINTTTGICTISGNGEMTNERYPSAFSSKSDYIRSVVVEEGVTCIPRYAFHGCQNLQSVMLSNTVHSIGKSAFWDCPNLTAIEIPESLDSLGAHVFDSCVGLSDVIIPESVTSIGTGVFCNCTALSDTTVSAITNPLFYEESDTFCGCTSLTEIIVPDSVRVIGSNVFGKCAGLTRIVIPDSVEIISFSAFRSCVKLNDFYIPKYTVSIEENAFLDCVGLQNVYYDLPYSRLEEIAVESALLDLQGVTFNCKEADSDFLIKEKDSQLIILGYLRDNITAQIPNNVTSWRMTKSDDTLREIYLPSTLNENCNFDLYIPNVYIMDGAQKTGRLVLKELNNIYIPQSVTDLDGLSVTPRDSQSPTVYCYEDSEGEIWALSRGYNIRYVTNPSEWDALSYLEDLRWDRGTIYLDVDESFTFEPNQFTIMPQDATGLIPIIHEALGLEIEGQSITARAPGNYMAVVQMGGKTVNVPVHVYRPVSYFTLNGPDLVKTGDSVSLAIAYVSADSSNRFTWYVDGEETEETGTALTFIAPNEPQMLSVKVIANSGLEREVIVWVASEISDPYVDGYARNAVVGSLIDVLVDVDGVTYRNDPRTIQDVMVNLTSGEYITVYRNTEVLVKKAGRCVFSVTGYNGHTVNILVVSHDPIGTLTIPVGCKCIDNEAFFKVAAEKVIIPSGCECVQAKAFAESNVKLIVLPETLNSIDDSILENCDNVTIACTENSYAHLWAERLGFKTLLN